MSGKTIASLQAVIGADVSGFMNGANQVKSTIAGMQKAGAGAFSGSLTGGNQFTNTLMKQADAAGLDSRQMYRLADATGLYKQSQLQVAASSGFLAKKSFELTEAVNQGRMTATEAGKAYRTYYDQQQQMIRGSMSWTERNKAWLNPVQWTAAAAGVTMAGKAIYSFARSGAELEFTQTRFDRLSRSVGTTSDIFMNQLRIATKGTVSDMQLAKQGADLFQLGLARTSDEAVRLSRVQTALGMDTGELTLALANQSKRRLDQLGLSLNKFNEIEAQLKKQGMGDADAFREAFLQTAEQTVVTTGNMADSSIGDFQRLEASAKNFWDTFKMSSGNTLAPVARDVGMFFTGLNNLMQGNTVLDLSKGLGADSWVRQAQVQDKSSLWANGGTQQRQVFGGRGGVQTVNESITGLSALQSYTAMAYKAQLMGGQGLQKAPEAPEIDYAALTDSALKLTQANEAYAMSQKRITDQFGESAFVTDLYKQKVTELKDQKKAGIITDQKYYDSLTQLRAAFKDGSFAAQEQSQALAELEAASDKQAQAYALNALDIAGATAKQKYDFAEASGLMTKQAADQARAQEKLAAAYTSGQLSAEQYAVAIAKINGDVKSLDGLKAEAYVDVYIRAHGSLPDWALPGKDSPSLNQDLSGLLAGGSTDVQPGVYEFNEAGAEGLVMRSDGSVAVVPHSEWEKMKKYGIMPQAGYRSGTFGVGASGGLGSSASSAARNISARGGRLDASAVLPRGISEPSESQTEQDKTTASKLATVIEKMNNQATQKNILPQTVALDKATIRELQKGIAKEVANLVG